MGSVLSTCSVIRTISGTQPRQERDLEANIEHSSSQQPVDAPRQSNHVRNAVASGSSHSGRNSSSASIRIRHASPRQGSSASSVAADDNEQTPLLSNAETNEPRQQLSYSTLSRITAWVRPGAETQAIDHSPDEISFSDLEKRIQELGTGTLSYMDAVRYRFPHLGKDVRDTAKDSVAMLAGIGTAYLIGTGLGLPTGYLFGSELGNRLTRMYRQGANTIQSDERPLGQEVKHEWEKIKKILAPQLETCSDEVKQAAIALDDLVDYGMREFTKSTRTEVVTAAHINLYRPYMMRYAWVICSNMQPKHIEALSSNSPNYQKLQSHLRGYDSAIQGAVENFLAIARNNSDPNRSPQSMASAYLGGYGGTGKTTMVKMIADVLNVPFIMLDMSAITLNQLRGDQRSNQKTQGSQSLEDLVGKLALEIVRSGVSNPLVFFDEADLNDKTMTAYMKYLLQASPVLKVPSCDIEIPINRVNLVFASNKTVDDAALAQRFPIITFPALTKEQKSASATERFDTQMAQIKENNAELADEVTTIASRWLEYIVDEDLKRNPGGRVIKNVVSDFISRVERDLNASPRSINWGDNATVEQIVADIYMAYPQEEMGGQRVSGDRVPTLVKFINEMKSRVSQDTNVSNALTALSRKCEQQTVIINDSAMQFLVNALLGTKVASITVQITNKDDKKDALYLISLLVKESMRATAKPEHSWSAAGTCLSRLRDLVLANTLDDSALQIEALTIIRDILSQLPVSPANLSKKREKAIDKLSAWQRDNAGKLHDSVQTIATSITNQSVESLIASD